MKKTLFFTFLALLILSVLAFLEWSDVSSQKRKNLQRSAPKGSLLWLNETKQLAQSQGEAAFELATYFAHQDHKEVNESVLWFKQAIRLQHPNAVLALATLYVEHEQYELAYTLLKDKNTTSNTDSLLLGIKVAVVLGDLNYIQDNVNKLKSFEQGKRLLQQLRQYQVLPENQITMPEEVKSCENNIQFIATNFADLIKSERLIKRFNTHPLATHFCFNPVRYQAINTLKCKTLFNSPDEAIQCDESIWHGQTLPRNTRYLAVLLPQGGANVHKGILYLDSNDSFEVFIHELSHLLGFIDEYTLPKGHSVCSSHQSEVLGYNLAVLPTEYQGERAQIRRELLGQIPWAEYIHPDTPILHKGENSWLLGTPESYDDQVGVFPSDTCNNNLLDAFKPLSYGTMLTYNEMIFPMLYQTFIKKTPNIYRMPSYHLNVAKALWLKGKEQEAKYWFERLQP